MISRAHLSRAAGPTLYLVAVLWIAAMAFTASWPDMEAGDFDASTMLAADAALPSLHCPWVMASDERTEVRARFENLTPRTSSFLVRSRITSGFVSLVREASEQVTLAPGEARELVWPVTVEDAAYDRLVLVRVLATGGPDDLARQNSCGILVIGITGIRGQSAYLLAVLAGLVGMGMGAWLWWWQRRPLGRLEAANARRLGFLGLLVLSSLAAGLAGSWLASHLLLILAFVYPFLLLESASLADT